MKPQRKSFSLVLKFCIIAQLVLMFGSIRAVAIPFNFPELVYRIIKCHNDEKAECDKTVCGITTTVSVPLGNTSCSYASKIINNSLEYFGTSKDFFISNTPSGCNTCSGGITSGNILPSLGVTRLMRPRYTDWQEGDLQASFGYGIYWQEIDRTLRIDSSNRILVHNPSDHDQSVDAIFDASRSGWADIENSYFQTVSLFDVNGNLISDIANTENARTAIKLNNDGSTEHYEFFWMRESDTQGHSGSRAVGRLTALMDRNGNTITVTYQHQIRANGRVTEPGEGQFWPKFNVLWKKDTVTDAYGRQIKCHYVFKKGRYVISRLELPNTEEITYEYGWWTWWDGMLRAVNHPDGSRSTISTTPYGSSLLKVTQSDRSAKNIEQKKHIYITHHWGNNEQGEWGRQAPHLVRQVDNGADEVKYANNNVQDANGIWQSFIYEGGNRLIKGHYISVGGATDTNYVIPTAQINFNDAASLLAAPTLKIANNTFDSRAQTTGQTDTLGRNVSLLRNPLNNAVLSGTRRDGTAKSATFNSFTQPLTQIDSLGRSTISTYDILGNKLSHTTAAGTPDESTTTYIYNTRGQIIETRDALYDANTPELHNTRYEYNATGYLTKKIDSADTAGGTRPQSLFTYDAVGRITTSTDPLGRTSTFEYDSRDRLIKTTYNDTSTELIEYGAGDNANLIISTTDRNGIKTEYTHDDAGRISQSQIKNHQSQILSETTSTYLAGTTKKLTTTRNGETTSYGYDYANRLVGTIIKANSNTNLTTTREYDQLDRLRSTTDPYGRKTYYLYDQNDRITRTVTETVPNGLTNVPAFVANSTQTVADHNYTLTTLDNTTLETNPNSDNRTHKVTYTDPRDLYLQNLVRDNTSNAKFLITDTIYDSEGQRLITTDPRGINTWAEHDNLGRTTLTIVAVGTPSEIRSEQDYDENSNLVETRSPRHFTEGAGTPANLTGVGKDTYTYNGRNMRATHNTAVGSTEEQVQSWTYYLDGRSDEHTDFRGNIAKQIWHTCCGRLQATIQRDGTSTTIHNTDYNGNPTHTSVLEISNLPQNPSYNWHDPVNADTLLETTTRFDGRGRPTHTTTWLTPLGNVIDHARASLGNGDIPIAGLDSIPATDGLTTTYVYDEDLTDGIGIDQDYATQLTELTARYGYNPFSDGSVGVPPASTPAPCNGYAIAITNPAGETTVTIQDSAGRTIMSINPEGDITTMHYDELATAADFTNPQLPIPGTLLATTATDALGNSNSSYTDGAGRTIATEDAEANLSMAAYNANSSVVTTRDANGLGQTCTYDALNRPVTCADLQETAEGTDRATTYNAASQVLTSTNADGETTTNVYDVRSRLESTTDPNNITTSYLYDANNNLITLTDGNNNQRGHQAVIDHRDNELIVQFGIFTLFPDIRCCGVVFGTMVVGNGFTARVTVGK